ncbi:MAG: peptidylprolyl isomerase [Deltaproteobacteria bacterium]|nr:peptidylprolyl isomerase [Deltaproteobacteria bacterium]
MIVPRAIAALLAIASVAGCERAANSTRARIVVSIKGPEGVRGAVERPEVELALARIRRERREPTDSILPETLVRAIVDRQVEHRILLLEADRHGVQTSTSAVERELLGMREERGPRAFARALLDGHHSEDEVRAALLEGARIAELLRQKAHAGLSVSEVELNAAFEALPEEAKRRNERARARHIVVRTREEGRVVLEKLAKGASFSELARKHSLAPEAPSGGDLGWIERGTLPPVFDACFDLPEGKASPLVPSDYGFHIFLVEGREPARRLTFDDLKDRLARDLLATKLEEAEDKYVAGLRSAYTIRVKDAVVRSLLR